MCDACEARQRENDILKQTLARIHELSAPCAAPVQKPADMDPSTLYDLDDMLTSMHACYEASQQLLEISVAQRERLTTAELKTLAEHMQVPYAGTRSAMLRTLTHVASQTLRFAAEADAVMQSKPT